MPITDDDQIDLERVVTDPEYRRHVIMYLNAKAHRIDQSHQGTLRAVPTHFSRSAMLRPSDRTTCAVGAD